MARLWAVLSTFAGDVAKISVAGAGAVKSIAFARVPHYTRWGLYPQAIVFVACYTVWQLSAIWQIFPLIPGAAIAGLGFVAVIMTVRADQFSNAERVVWVILGFAIMVFEIHTLYLDRQRNDAQHFAETAKQQQEFEATLGEFEKQSREVGSVLTTTQGIANLAEENLEETTGGNTYMYFDVMGVVGGPSEINLPEIRKGEMITTGIPKVVGNYPLHNVFVAIFGPEGWQPSIDYGTMFPRELGRPRQSVEFRFFPDRPNQRFNLWINTSNGSYSQAVLFLEQGNKWFWASRFYKAGRKKPLRVWAGPGFPKERLNGDW
jgi:hypothetical protein